MSKCRVKTFIFNKNDYKKETAIVSEFKKNHKVIRVKHLSDPSPTEKAVEVIYAISSRKETQPEGSHNNKNKKRTFY